MSRCWPDPLASGCLARRENLTETRCAEAGVAHAGILFGLLEVSDVVSIHLVQSERTRSLFGADEPARMKPDACVVTTSRGADRRVAGGPVARGGGPRLRGGSAAAR